MLIIFLFGTKFRFLYVVYDVIDDIKMADYGINGQLSFLKQTDPLSGPVEAVQQAIGILRHKISVLRNS